MENVWKIVKGLGCLLTLRRWGEKGSRKPVKMRNMLMAPEKGRKLVEKNWQEQNTHQWTTM